MYRYATAAQAVPFNLVSKATGDDLAGLAVTVTRTIDGGAQAPATGTVADKGSGLYVFTPSVADLAGYQIGFKFAAAGAVSTVVIVVTTKANPQDADAFGLGNLDAKVTTRSTFVGPAGLSTLVIQDGGVKLWLAQPVPMRDQTDVTAPTAGDCLAIGWADAAGDKSRAPGVAGAIGETIRHADGSIARTFVYTASPLSSARS